MFSQNMATESDATRSIDGQDCQPTFKNMKTKDSSTDLKPEPRCGMTRPDSSQSGQGGSQGKQKEGVDSQF